MNSMWSERSGIMLYDIFSRGRILVIAHRGFEARAPENTLIAFRMALQAGADGIELDLQLAKDGALVVMHDPSVDRTTNGSGKVSKMTLPELKQLDAGFWFAPEFAGEQIPTLDEVFRALPENAILAIETKPLRAAETIARKVIASVRVHHAEKRVLILSYNPVTLACCKKLCPEIPVMLIHEPTSARRFLITCGRIVSGLRPDVWSFEWFVLQRDKERVAQLHRKGIKVCSGVVPTETEMRFIGNLGVDGMMTSDPIRLRKVLEEE